MTKRSRRRMAVAVAAAGALAASGAVAAWFSTSASAGNTALAALPVPGAATRPTPPLTGMTAPSVPAAAARPGRPVVTVKPPPVVGGVRRVNVGSAHSPQLARLLSGPASGPPPSDAGGLGIDVASYQHPGGAAVNWHQVAAAGYKFAFIKATEGNYYINPYYASDLAQAKAAGLYVAGYHFAVPNISSGASQADYAVRNASYTTNGHTLPLALDIEYNPYGGECYGLSHPQMVSWLSSFTSEVRHLTGQLPVIYSTADWWRTCTGNSAAFGADELWVAGYGTGAPAMPAGWSHWTFWQFTSHGKVPGISGNVDLSYFGRSGALPAAPPSSPAPAAPPAPATAPPPAVPPPSPSPSLSPSPPPSATPSPSPSASS